MNINKQTAELVAKEITKSKAEQIEKIKSEMAELVRQNQLATTPAEVLGAHAKHPKYFYVSNSVTVYGPGIAHSIRVKLENPLPTRCFNTEVELLPEVASKFVKLENKSNDLTVKLKALQRDIAETLYKMRSYKKIESEWPEAFALIPSKPVTTTVAVPLSDILERLKK